MSAVQSAWIREVVWPPARRNSDHPWFRTCSCERARAENSSGACSSGQHDRCNWLGSLPLRPIPEAYLCIPAGTTQWLALAPLWEAHHTHYANCPCECHENQVGLFRGLPS